MVSLDQVASGMLCLRLLLAVTCFFRYRTIVPRFPVVMLVTRSIWWQHYVPQTFACYV